MTTERLKHWGLQVGGWGLSLWLVGLTGVMHAAEGTGSTPTDVAAQVDRLLERELGLSSGSVAPRVRDQVFLRRVSIDLVGQLPTPTEVTLFALDPSPEKRQAWVERLLDDGRFGTNWSRYWRDVVMYRRADDRALLSSQPLANYLRDQFNANRPWDEIAREMINGRGNIAEHGEAAIFVAQMAEAVDVAAEFSRIFLGVQIQCAQCHDHPTDRWKREEFHQFAAFFPRVSLRPLMGFGGQRGFEIASRDSFDGGGRPGGGQLEHFMPDLKDPQSRGTQMIPVFFATGQKLDSGSTDEQRRSSIGTWMTSPENPWFARAFVNRLWAELVGEGFYEPIDDLGPDREATAPETLAYLAGEFAGHGFDVKWLFKTILATEAYQRESRPRRLPDQTPFAANVPQRIRGDALFDILNATLGIEPAATPAPQGNGGPFALLAGPRGQFNQAFGYDPSVRRDDVTGTIPQALLLMNSSYANSRGVLLGRLLQESSDNEEAIIELYLRCLAREPNDQELDVCLNHLASVGNRLEGFEDLLWSLINRAEFVHRN